MCVLLEVLVLIVSAQDVLGFELDMISVADAVPKEPKVVINLADEFLRGLIQGNDLDPESFAVGRRLLGLVPDPDLHVVIQHEIIDLLAGWNAERSRVLSVGGFSVNASPASGKLAEQCWQCCLRHKNERASPDSVSELARRAPWELRLPAKMFHKRHEGFGNTLRLFTWAKSPRQIASGSQDALPQQIANRKGLEKFLDPLLGPILWRRTERQSEPKLGIMILQARPQLLPQRRLPDQ